MPGSAVELAVAYVSIVPEVSKIKPVVAQALGAVEGDAEKSGKKTGQRFSGGVSGAIGGLGKKVFAPLAAAAAGVSLVEFFKDAVSGASDLEQSVGGVEAVFKSQAGAIKKASAEAAQNLGLSKNAYNELATVLGAGLKNQGIKDFAGQTQGLISIGADLAAQYGGSTKDAVDALASAMRGESDPIERYGISLNETAVNAELASKGQDKLKGAALSQAKAMARIAIIQRQSADAQGAFARESDTLAGKQARLSAAWENAKTALGGVLLPIMSRALDVMAGMSGGVAQLWASFTAGDNATGGLAAAFASLASSPFGQWVQQMGRDLAATLLPALRSIGDTITGDLVPAFMGFLNAVVNSPLTKVLLSILGPILKGMIQGVVDTVKGAVNILSGLFKLLGGVLTGDWSQAWEGIKQVASGAIQALWGLLQAGLLGRVLGIFRAAGAAIKEAWAASGTVGAVLSGFGSFVMGIFSGIGQELALLFPKFGAFAGVVKTALSGVGSALSLLASMASAAWVGLTAGLQAAWNGLVNGVFVPFKDWLMSALPAAWAKLKADAAADWASIVGGITAGWKVLVGAATATWGAIAGVIAAAWSAVASGTATAWTAISGAVTAAWNALMGGVFTPLRTWVTATLPAAWSTFLASVTAAWAGVTAAISAAWAGVTIVFNAIRTWLTATLVAAFNGYRLLVVTVWQAVAATITAAWATILAVFTVLRTWITATLTAAFTAFRVLAAAVWAAITSTITAAWNTILVVFTTLRSWLTATLTAALTTFRATVAAVWSAVTAAVSAAWNTLLASVFTPLRTWLTATFVAALTLFRSTVASVWSAVTSAISSAWNTILAVAFNPVRTWLTSTLVAALNTFRSTVATVWSAVVSTISSAWSRVSATFSSLRDGLTGVWNWFKTVVAGIGATWDGIKAKITDPVRYVVNSIIRDKLVAAWNAVAGKLSLPTFSFAGFAGGGWTGPGSKYQPAGIVHADEFVISKASRRRIERERPGMLDAMNRTGRVPGYANGGRVIPGYAAGGAVTNWDARTPSGLRMWAAFMRTYIRGKFGIPDIGGYRPVDPFPDHPSGRALDIMVYANRSKGDSVASWLMANSAPTNLDYLIWKQRSWNPSRGTWKGMSDRGGITANHYDHVHALFRPGGGNPAGFGGTLTPEVIAQLQAGGGGSFSMANPLATAAKALVNPLFNGAKALADGVVGRFGSSPWTAIVAAAAKLPVQQMQTWLTSKIDAVFPEIQGGLGTTAKLFDGGGLLERGDIAVHAARKPDRVLTAQQWEGVMKHLPLRSTTGPGGFGVDGGVHIHGDVFGDPDRYAARVTTRMRDELALVNLAGV